MPRAVWSHNTMVCRATNFTSFRLLFRVEAVLPEEIKHQILHTATEVSSYPNKAEEKDLLESDRHKAVANLQKYQDETRSWRDPNVKTREFNMGSLVILRSPHTESSSKLESKWDGQYVVTEKQGQGLTILRIPKEQSWSICGTQTTSIALMFKHSVRAEAS
jgi:hypothetical protein